MNHKFPDFLLFNPSSTEFWIFGEITKLWQSKLELILIITKRKTVNIFANSCFFFKANHVKIFMVKMDILQQLFFLCILQDHVSLPVSAGFNIP